MRKTAPPSVALFMHDLSGGGVERMRLRLASELAARGHAVTLIVQHSHGVLRSLVPQGVDLVDLASRHTWIAAIRLAGVLRARRPDVLVSSLDHNNIAALCARLLAGRRTRIVICQHNALSAEAAIGWRYRAVPFLYRLLAGWADEIVAVSEGVADDLAATAGLSRTRMTVIHNPVVSEPAACVAATPHPWLGDTSVPVFLFVGRLVPQKDPLLLLRAFALLLQTKCARLLILGEGPLLPTIHQIARDLGIAPAVHCAGFVSDPGPWMARSTALVLSSRYEGFGNVIVEALACGTPVIATDCPHGPREILAGGRFGWLVPVGDAHALAAAMADDVRANFTASRLQKRAQCFSVAACVNRHQALFHRLLRRRRQLFGLAFSELDAGEICALMVRQGAHGTLRPVVSQNLDTIRLLHKSSEYCAASRAAALICPDGFPVVIYARLRGAWTGARVTGCDIFHRLAQSAQDHRRKVCVVAESCQTADALRDWIAYRALGAFWDVAVAPANLIENEEGQQELVARLSARPPDILVMALGAPVSEIFLFRYRSILPPCWALCCGQAVRVEMGLERRAPVSWQRLNLEWAWRLFREPRRLGPRYVRDVLSIPALLARDLVFNARQPIDPAAQARLSDYSGA